MPEKQLPPLAGHLRFLPHSNQCWPTDTEQIMVGQLSKSSVTSLYNYAEWDLLPSGKSLSTHRSLQKGATAKGQCWLYHSWRSSASQHYLRVANIFSALGGTEKVREQRWLPWHSKADISVEYVAADTITVTLQHLTLAPEYISSSGCPKPGNTPAPFSRHRKPVEDLHDEVTPHVHGRTGNWVCICFLRTFTHSKHLCRLDVGIWMLTLSALSWKSPSLNSHTQSSELQHTHIFLCFFQLCFLLLDSHDKHLPHFVLLLLEFTQEFIPLCFIGLLKTVKNTEKKKQSEVCFKHSPVLPSLRWSYHIFSSKNIVRSPRLQHRHERPHQNQSWLARWQQWETNWQGKKRAHRSGSCGSLNRQDDCPQKQAATM